MNMRVWVTFALIGSTTGAVARHIQPFSRLGLCGAHS